MEPKHDSSLSASLKWQRMWAERKALYMHEHGEFPKFCYLGWDEMVLFNMMVAEACYLGPVCTAYSPDEFSQYEGVNLVPVSVKSHWRFTS